MSLIKLMLVEPVLPAKSVSRRYNVNAPWESPANWVMSLKVVVALVQVNQLVLSTEHWGRVVSPSVNEIAAEALTCEEDAGEVIATTGEVLSTVNVAPDVGADVTVLPAKSVPVDKATVAAPSPKPTVSI